MAKKETFDHLFADEEAADTSLQSKTSTEFETLLKESGAPRRSFVAGDRLQGEILAISGNEAFVSTGTATDAVMPFAVGEGIEPPKIGDRVDVIVVRARDGEIFVKKVGSRGVGIEMDSLEDAYKMEVPVDGQVLEVIKGGFRVKVQGHKAFCPVSQMDLRVTRPEDYVDKKFSFLITKFERGRDLVVSRRKLLDAERASHEADFLKTAAIDDVFSATVFRLEKYGAFVRLPNGVEGLVPISEISFSRLNHPQDALNLDQKVQVKLIRLGEEEGRLRASFSIKQGGSVEDPWVALPEQFPVGSRVEGMVENREPFGLFVNIAQGITGLLPRSAWRDSTNASQFENKRRGERVLVQVERIDLDARKLSFTLPGEEVDETWRQHTGTGANTKSESMNSFADLLKGVKGR